MGDKIKNYIQRKDIDDIYARNISKNSYSNRTFSGKKSTKDEYTGSNVYKNPYFTSGKRAQTDHITPLKTLKERYGNDTGISSKEIKAIANSDYNLAITNARINQSKNSSTNIEYIVQQFMKGKALDPVTTFNMTTAQIKSEVAIKFNVGFIKTSKSIDSFANALGYKSNLSTNKMFSEFATNSAKMVSQCVESGIIAMTTALTSNAIAVAQGKLELGEAAIEVIKIGGSTTAVSALYTTSSKVINHVGAQTSKAILKDITPAQIAIAVNVGNSLIKYVNDEMSAEECAINISIDTVACATTTLAGVVFGPAGAIASSIVVSMAIGAIYNAIYEFKCQKMIRKANEEAFDRILHEANIALEKQKERIQSIIKIQDYKYQKAIDIGFRKLVEGSFERDTTRMTEGLNEILGLFNKKAYFSNEEEFNAFFYGENVTFRI